MRKESLKGGTGTGHKSQTQNIRESKKEEPILRKRILSLVLCFIAAVSILCSCSGGYTSSQNCVYCGSAPTKSFKTSNGSDCYVCEWCSTTCFFCGASVSKHYTNGFDEEMFVCADCYAEIASW